MSYLTAEEQAEIKVMEDFFAHPGWKKFLDHLTGEIEATEAALKAVKTEIDLGYTQGYNAASSNYKEYEAFYKTYMDNLDKSRQIEADSEAEDSLEDMKNA